MPAQEARAVARQLEPDLWVLDTWHQGEPGVVAAYLLTGPEGLALVDVGPAATVERVLAGIEATGHTVPDLRAIYLTHIHLDHAGAAGALAQAAPLARFYVHPLGAPHLINPTRLLASATRIYGDQTHALWGTPLPVPAARVRVLHDAESVHLGRWSFQALHTPGHAIHHIAYHDAARGVLFSGDVAGVQLQGIEYVRPPTPPPDLSLEDWSASLARLRQLPLQRLYLPHFGPVTRVAAHLAELEARLYEWGKLVLAGMRQGHDTDALVAALSAVSAPEVRQAAHGHDEAVLRRYELATNYRMTVQGYERYYRRVHPELLASPG